MNSRILFRIASLMAIGIFASTLFLVPIHHAQNSADPWTTAESVEAPNLIKELNDPKTAPTVTFVGFPRLHPRDILRARNSTEAAGTPRD